MASAQIVGKRKDHIRISAARGSLILNRREADQILADLQIMYHMVALGMDDSEYNKDSKNG